MATAAGVGHMLSMPIESRALEIRENRRKKSSVWHFYFHTSPVSLQDSKPELWLVLVCS